MISVQNFVNLIQAKLDTICETHSNIEFKIYSNEGEYIKAVSESQRSLPKKRVYGILSFLPTTTVPVLDLGIYNVTTQLEILAPVESNLDTTETVNGTSYGHTDEVFDILQELYGEYTGSTGTFTTYEEIKGGSVYRSEGSQGSAPRNTEWTVTQDGTTSTIVFPHAFSSATRVFLKVDRKTYEISPTTVTDDLWTSSGSGIGTSLVCDRVNKKITIGGAYYIDNLKLYKEISQWPYYEWRSFSVVSVRNPYTYGYQMGIHTPQTGNEIEYRGGRAVPYGMVIDWSLVEDAVLFNDISVTIDGNPCKLVDFCMEKQVTPQTDNVDNNAFLKSYPQSQSFALQVSMPFVNNSVCNSLFSQCLPLATTTLAKTYSVVISRGGTSQGTFTMIAGNIKIAGEVGTNCSIQATFTMR